MTPRTRERIDIWWGELFGLPASLMWHRGVVVGMHAGLGDYAGLFVAGRPGTARVSLPDWCDVSMVEELGATAADSLLSPAFWSTWEITQDLEIVGPSVHSYIDTEPASAAVDGISVEKVVTIADVAALADHVDPAEWTEAGFASEVLHCFAAYDGDYLVAAANLTAFDGGPADVGVLVAQDRRTSGIGRAVAAEAAAYAVRQHGVARWRARTDNRASRALASSLGFEDYCLQLAVRGDDVRE